MTISEIMLICDSYNQKQELELKTKLSMNYNLANLVSIFVNLRLNGKEVPTLQETYPEIFGETKQQQEKEDKSWMIYKEQFLDFARSHNKKWGENKIDS